MYHCTVVSHYLATKCLSVVDFTDFGYAKREMMMTKGRYMFRLKMLMICLLFCISVVIIAQDQPTLPTYATGETWVITNVPRLNVRSLPSAEDPNSIVHTIIKQGEHFPALGWSQDKEWVLIRISGDTAWVLTSAVLITNPENLLIWGEVSPEEDEAMRQLTAELVAYIKATVGVRDNLNIRLAPGIQNPIVGRIPYQNRAYPLDFVSNGQWYQVEYQGATGWVSAVYVTFPPGVVAPLFRNNAQG